MSTGDTQERAEFYRLNDEAIAEAHARAVDEVQKMEFSSSIDLPSKISGLGARVGASYSLQYERQAKHLGHALPEILALAVKVFWLAALDGALWFKYAIEKGVVANTPEMQLRAIPAGYLLVEGKAWTMYNKLAEGRFADMILKFLPNEELRAYATDQTLLTCIGLYWLHQATDAGGQAQLDLIYEGLDACELAAGLAMWDDAYEQGRSDALRDPTTLARLRSETGRAGAKERVRKDPRTQAKVFIRSCWQEWQQEPHRCSSIAQFAQDMLDKQPVLRSAAVIAGWCREWKREAEVGPISE